MLSPQSTPTRESSVIFKSLGACISEFEKQSIHPPGNDKVIQACYVATLGFFSDAKLSQDFGNIIQKRKYTPSHFVNIFFRSIQFIELYHRGSNKYPNGFDNVEKWKEELRIIFDTKFDLLKELLLTKDTTTTIYQRYAGSKMILNSLFSQKKINVADLGCGGNYGLPGLILDTPFRSISDHTSNKLASKFLKNRLQISKALAIDKENPYLDDSRKWRFSCSFYPHELNQAAEIILPNSVAGETIFTRIDLTKAENDPISMGIEPEVYDAVILSTFLYQLTHNQIKTVMKFAKKIVSNNGIIIIQDFARKDPLSSHKLSLLSNWFSHPNCYRTFITGSLTNWDIKEVLQWTNGRCSELYEGEDYDFIFKK